jgi:hypothetical protein
MTTAAGKVTPAACRSAKAMGWSPPWRSRSSSRFCWASRRLIDRIVALRWGCNTQAWCLGGRRSRLKGYRQDKAERCRAGGAARRGGSPEGRAGTIAIGALDRDAPTAPQAVAELPRPPACRPRVRTRAVDLRPRRRAAAPRGPRNGPDAPLDLSWLCPSWCRSHGGPTVSSGVESTFGSYRKGRP